jgi:hypothetical protein
MVCSTVVYEAAFVGLESHVRLLHWHRCLLQETLLGLDADDTFKNHASPSV